MFDVYLTEMTERSADPERVAELGTLGSEEAASGLCITLQPYLRDGIEAHFVTADE